MRVGHGSQVVWRKHGLPPRTSRVLTPRRHVPAIFYRSQTNMVAHIVNVPLPLNKTIACLNFLIFCQNRDPFANFFARQITKIIRWAGDNCRRSDSVLKKLVIVVRI
jgi:hypothetical protein